MSPVRKPSARGLQTAASQPAKDVLREADTPPARPSGKPARITLNLPPRLYRDLQRWCDTSAEALDVPRVGVQEALRGMITVITSGEAQGASERVQAAIWGELTG